MLNNLQIIHRKDAKNAKRSFFSLAVDPADYSGTGTPAREKKHFIWVIGLMTDTPQIDRTQNLLRSVVVLKDLKAVWIFLLSVLSTESKKYLNLSDLCVFAVN